MIICILQNSWGDFVLPLFFIPNPRNHSARIIKKLVGEKEFVFCNTTNEFSFTAKGKLPYKKEHFEKVVNSIEQQCKRSKDILILVCGRQAEKAFKEFQDRFDNMNIPYLIIPHPASRNLSNIKCKEITEKINQLLSPSLHTA